MEKNRPGIIEYIIEFFESEGLDIEIVTQEDKDTYFAFDFVVCGHKLFSDINNDHIGISGSYNHLFLTRKAGSNHPRPLGIDLYFTDPEFFTKLKSYIGIE